MIVGKNLGKFINTNNLDVEFFIGENSYTYFNSLIDKDAKVLWKKSNYKKNYLSKVFYVDSILNKERAGLNARARLEKVSLNDPIKPGVFVEVMIKGNIIRDSFLVDENNIYEDMFILILDNDRVKRKKIEIKGFADGKVIIAGKNINNLNMILTRINNISLVQKVISKK